MLGLAFSWIAAPAWYWSVPDGIELGITTVDTLGEALLLVPLGVVVAFVGIGARAARPRLRRTRGAAARQQPDPELSAQVTGSARAPRSRIIAAADAERSAHRARPPRRRAAAPRRAVADAADGRDARREGDPETADLIRNAGEEAGLALKELRDLARGIHPAILTNRGLAAALDDLAARATVPVEVTAAPSERLPDQVEAAAYFVVSECLANVDKHAEASGATVSVRPRTAGSSRVQDDGTGGADTENGSGIQGLRDRVGGSAVRASIPLVVSRRSTTRWRRRAPPAARGRRRGRAAGPAQAASARAGWNRRRVAATLVLIWALTGTDKPWIVWPLLGLGLVATLDAWFVLGGRPLRESDLDGAESGPLGGDARCAAAGACASTRAPWPPSTSS